MSFLNDTFNKSSFIEFQESGEVSFDLEFEELWEYG